MKPKTTKILYWIFLSLFLIMMLMDGIAGVVKEKTGQEVMHHLGYPVYALVIFGVAKIAGVLALLQTKFRTIKEWAFAGFTINFLGAAASRGLAGDPAGLIFAPIIALAFMFFVYWLWKKYEALHTTPTYR